MKLAEEFMAGMLAKDLIEPTRVGLGVFSGKNLNDVALFKLGI